MAIIVDSFWEALASRVLWILLVLITVVLVALAPVGYRSELTTEIRTADLVDGRELASELWRAGMRDEPSPGRRIWSLLDDETRKAILTTQTTTESNYFDEVDRLRGSLNALLERPDLYSEQDWNAVRLNRETRQLLKRPPEQLPLQELKRRNRLLIQAGFPDRFRTRPAESVLVTYFGLDVSPPLPIGKQRMDSLIEQWILATLVSLLVGTVALIAAVLVTAPIIPQMFESGSLHLLLSKPISRSGMFLSKYFGGCAFILLNVTYLVVGLWLIAGLRFGIWNDGLLKCIPIFLFLFAIYYSVSAFAGVIWRNAVVSVVITVLFWFACFSVNATKAVIESTIFDQQRLTRLIQAGDSLLAANERGQTHRWNAESEEWQQIFESSDAGSSVVLGPVYDPRRDMLLAGQGWRGQNFGFLSRQSTLALGKRSDGWQRVAGPSLPSGTVELLLEPTGGILSVSSGGVFRISGDPEKAGSSLSILGWRLPFGGGSFQDVGPRRKLGLQSPIAAAIDPDTASLAIYSRGAILRLGTSHDGRYELQQERELEGEKGQAAGIVCAGSRILVARADGKLWLLDEDNLDVLAHQVPEAASQPRFLAASPGGRWFATVFQNGKLWLVDAESQRFFQPAVLGQGSISAVTFPASNTVLIADRTYRVTQYRLDSLEQEQQFAPEMSRFEMIYRYIIVPLYVVFPKPSELDNTIQYVLTGRETTDMGMQADDLQAAHVKLHPWAPIQSSLIFTLIVLLAACLYIEWQEF